MKDWSFKGYKLIPYPFGKNFNSRVLKGNKFALTEATLYQSAGPQIEEKPQATVYSAGEASLSTAVPLEMYICRNVREQK